MAATPVDLADTLGRFTDLWSPKVVARMNDYEVKVVKVETHALLIEPVGVVNTGDAGGPLTAAYDDSLAGS
jgi:hypothetical protein